MKNRQYHGVRLSKKESELVEFLQTGSNDWVNAYFIYKDRRKHTVSDTRKYSSWFNKTLKHLHKKGLFLNVPFVYHSFIWKNPGVDGSKANFVALTLEDGFRENVNLTKKII